MLKKSIMIILIVAMLGVIMVYFTKPGSMYSENNIFKNKADKNTYENADENIVMDNSQEKQASVEENDPNKPELGEEWIPEENKVNMPQSVETHGLDYNVNSVRVTKEKGDFLIEPYMKWTEYQSVDEMGNMTGEYSYAIVNVTIRNISDTPQKLYLMNIHLQIRDQEGKTKYRLKGEMSEVRTFSWLDSSKGHTAATFELAPGESYEGELAFTESDEMLKDGKLELVIKPSAMYDYNEDTRVIRMY